MTDTPGPPVDAAAEVASLLDERRVVEVRLDERSADLGVEFEGGKRLEILTDSAGYEAWLFTAPSVELVASAGGGVVSIDP